MTAPARTPTPSLFGSTGRSPLPIRLHPSVLVAVALVTVLLASSVLPQRVPGRGGTAYLLAALLGAVVFLLSLLAHEVGHAVLARRNGVPVKSITLWALGGMAELDGEPGTPGAQFRIAGVGPLISAVAGAGLLGGALVTDGLPAAVLGWTGVTNLAIAAFNLLPGAPLDGGRLVAAVVWKRTGDRTRGTAAASHAGRGVGLVVAAVGAGLTVTGSVGNGVWLLIVGWFLASAARLEGARVSVVGALHGMSVEQVMTPANAEPGWLTVEAFLERVALPSRDTVFALAAFDGAPAGVVTLRQLTAVPATSRSAVRAVGAGTALGGVGIAEPGEPADVLAARLGRTGVVLVVSAGVVVGLVTAADLTRAVQLASVRGGDPTSPSTSGPAGPAAPQPDGLVSR